MTRHQTPASFSATFSRRALLKAGGALVVSIGAPAAFASALADGHSTIAPIKPALTPDQLSSYLAVNGDGTISAFFGKMDMGQGVSVAIRQMVAEELDARFEAVKLFIGDTDTSVNQGGASGSTGIQEGGRQMRMAAAEARRILVELAADRLGVAPDQLVVTNGVVHRVNDPGTKTTYGELVRGQFFNVQLDWNGKYGNALYAPGKAKPKEPSAHTIVGQSIKRDDIAPKVFAQQDFCTDIKVPGMVHGRIIRPPVAGAVPTAVDESAIKNIPGGRVVWDQGFLGVVADREWGAIKAAQQIKVEWSNAPPPFPDQAALYDHIRNAPVRKRELGKPAADVDDAFKNAARVIAAEYEWPFQSHACMGPAAAVVEIKDGRVTCWTGTQKAHFVQLGIAAILGVPHDQVRVIWTTGPGSYGRSDADDCAMDAALLAKAVGKPVRLQYMRDQGTGWDPKAPASIHRVRAAIDASGNVIAYDFVSKGFSRVDVSSNGSQAKDTLAGQTRGAALNSGDGFAMPGESYGFANKRTAWETIAPLLDRASPLRTSHMRDPVGPQIHFASELFIDEMAAALAIDPVAFRLRYVKDPRDIAVIKAAAEKAGWQARPSPRRNQSGTTVSGRGIAYAQRGPTRVAVIAEVEVDRSSGRIWVRKFTAAHDCGQIINPDGVRHAVECNLVQGASRALWEEVTFDNSTVTSVDWKTYPILNMTEAPEQVDVVLINRPDIAPSGAGEASTRPVAAAIANAVFDATGVRIRRAPLSPDRVKAALS